MDLLQHLLRQMAFSHATFGPGARTEGVINHIRKELIEVENAKGSIATTLVEPSDKSREWVDIVILALDGLTRSLAFSKDDSPITERKAPDWVAEVAVGMILEKQSENEARVWADWRTAPKDKAIEHIREKSE